MNNSNEAGNLLPIQDNNGEPTIESTEIAKELGNEHKHLMGLLRTHQKAIEKDFGVLLFKTAKSGNQGGRPSKVAKLNEGHAIALVTLSRNTERSVPLKLKIAKSFMFFRQKTFQLSKATSNNPFSELEQMDFYDEPCYYLSEVSNIIGEEITGQQIGGYKSHYDDAFFRDIHRRHVVTHNFAVYLFIKMQHTFNRKVLRGEADVKQLSLNFNTEGGTLWQKR